MPSQHIRLTVDQSVDLIQNRYGLPLSHEGLVDVCEGGWTPCRLDSQGGWTIDSGELAARDVAHDLMQQIARLASERQAAEDAMLEPPAGAEAEQTS
jgi:hypothetical protein